MKTFLPLLILVVAASLAACRTAAPASTASAASRPAALRQLVFARGPAFEMMSPLDLYLITEDGTGLARLTTAPDAGLDSAEPAWSADGQQLAFVRYTDAGNRIGDIFTARLATDGNGSPILADEVNRTASSALDDLGPSWAPDGSKVAFSNGTGNDPQSEFIHALVLADGTTPRLTDGLPPERSPSWSPVGGKVAFTRNAAIFVVDVATKRVDRLSPDGSGDENPSWNSTGTRILFVRGGESERRVMEMDATDTNGDHFGDNLVTVFTSPPGACDSSPVFAPESDAIAFARGPCRGAKGIGSERAARTPAPAAEERVDSDIYIRNVATGVETNITNTKGDNELTPVWRPSGRRSAVAKSAQPFKE